MRTAAEAASLARDGDTVEIERGDYRRDVAVWTQRRLTIRGVNGRPRLIADGAAAEGKAIFVVRNGTIEIENIEFLGAHVPDRNGAGIRFERGRLVVRNCRFQDNENGILAGNDPQAELEIHNSEFIGNGAGDGYSHNLYAGSIARLVVHASYFSQARVGHLVKTRAAENFISYNRLTDEPEGRASYELEFAGGGLAVVIGNIIAQSATTENSTIISYGVEGYRGKRNALYLANNTIVNDRAAGGRFLAVAKGPATIVAVNNVTVGRGPWDVPAAAELRGNVTIPREDFADLARFDLRLKASSRWFGAAAFPAPRDGISLTPTEEYVHPAGSRPLQGLRILSPGAVQAPSF